MARVQPSWLSRHRRKLGAAAVILCLLLFWLPGGFWMNTEEAQFRMVRTGDEVYFFDAGEHPEIDGFRYADPGAATALQEERAGSRQRFNIVDRHSLPLVRDDDSPEFAQEFGSIKWNSGPLELPVIGTVGWLERIEPTLIMASGRFYRAGGVTADYRPEPLSDEHFPALADYLDRVYPGRDYGTRVRRGLRTEIRIEPGTKVFVASNTGLLGLGLILLWPRKRPAGRRGEVGPA